MAKELKKVNDSFKIDYDNKLIHPEIDKSFANSFISDKSNLFDEISDLIIEEKGYVSEDEIQQLVEMLRKKVKKLQDPNYEEKIIPEDDKSSENLQLVKPMNNESEPDVSICERTMKALEIITDKMSNYIIQEKGEIIEEDILEITDQLRQFSSLTIASKNFSNTDHMLSTSSFTNSFASATPKRNVKSTAITNVKSKIRIDPSDKFDSSVFSSINRKEGEEKNYLKHEIDQKTAVDFNRSAKTKENLVQPSKLRNSLSNRNETSNFHQTKTIDNVNLLKINKNEDKKNWTQTPNQQNADYLNRGKFSNNKAFISGLTCTKNNEGKLEETNSKISRRQQKVISANGEKGRHHWKLGKNKIIFFKTTNYLNSVISIEYKNALSQGNMLDTSEKISVLFNKVVDILLEKFNIKEKDVEEIANILKQNQTKMATINTGKEFVAITPDIPQWALRGYIGNLNKLSNIENFVSSLLEKMVQYVIYEKGNILQSDITSFCSILRKKLSNNTGNDTREFFETTQAAQKNLKARNSDIRINSFKFLGTLNSKHSIQNNENKKTSVIKSKQPVSTAIDSIIKQVKTIERKKSFSIDAAIEEGIRSLEYIKQLSERILNDLDDKSDLDSEKIKKLLPLKISRNLSLDQTLQFQTCSNEYNRVKSKAEIGHEKKTKGNLSHKENLLQTNFCNRLSTLKPTQADKTIENCKKEKSKIFTRNNTNINKSERPSSVRLQTKCGRSDRDNNLKHEELQATKARPEILKSRQNSKTVLRQKTDTKKCITTVPQNLDKSLESNNNSRVYKNLRSEVENQQDILAKCKNIDIQEVQDDQPINVTNHLNSSSDKSEQKIENIMSREVILKVSRTYSVFKPFLPDSHKSDEEENLINYSCKPVVTNQEKNEETPTKTATQGKNYFREKYCGSKIPIRTLYHTGNCSATKK